MKKENYFIQAWIHGIIWAPESPPHEHDKEQLVSGPWTWKANRWYKIPIVRSTVHPGLREIKWASHR